MRRKGSRQIEETKQNSLMEIIEKICSVKWLISVNTITFLLITTFVMFLANFFTSFYSLGLSNAEKDRIILTHTRQVSFEFLNHVFSLPFEFRDRIINYNGAIDMQNEDFTNYLVETSHQIFDNLAYSSILRLIIADVNRNVMIFDHKDFRVPDTVQLWYGNHSEYHYNKTGGYVGEGLGDYSPLHRTPIYKNDTNGKYYLVKEMSDIKKYFSIDSLNWYSVGMSLQNETQRSTVESLCVCGFLYLFTATRLNDAMGNQLAVVGSALAVEEIGNFLKELELTADQTVVVINQDTHHIMASNKGKDTIPYGMIDETGKHLILAYESEYELLKIVYTEMLSLTNNFNLNVEEIFGNGQYINGHIIYVQTFCVNSVNFIAITMINGYDVYEVTLVSSLAFLGVAITSIIIGSIISSILSCVITNPLSGLMKKMKRVEEMELNVDTKNRSWLLEIRSIQESLEFMIKKLKQFRAFLPPEIFKKINRKNFNSEKFSNVDTVSNTSEESGNETVNSLDIQDNNAFDSFGKKRFELGIAEVNYATVAYIKLHLKFGKTAMQNDFKRVKLIPRLTILKIFNEFIEEMCTSHKGRVIDFNEDFTMVIGWNIGQHNTTHHIMASKCCILIVNQMHVFEKQLKDNRLMYNLNDIKVHIGVSTDFVNVLTIGMESRKKMIYEGMNIDKSKVLANIAMQKQHSMIICTSLKEELVNNEDMSCFHFVYSAVDVISNIHFEWEKVYAVNTAIDQPTNKEWLYLVPIMDAKEDNSILEKEFDKLMKGILEKVSYKHFEKNNKTKKLFQQTLINIQKKTNDYVDFESAKSKMNEKFENIVQEYIDSRFKNRELVFGEEQKLYFSVLTNDFFKV